MTYIVTQGYAHGDPTSRWYVVGEPTLRWDVVDGMGDRYSTDSRVEALRLAAMLNLLTPDQRNAASVEAVAKWKDTA